MKDCKIVEKTLISATCSCGWVGKVTKSSSDRLSKKIGGHIGGGKGLGIKRGKQRRPMFL